MNMPLSQSRSDQALFRSCMKAAAEQGRTLMEKLVEHCRQSMYERADMSNSQERKVQLDALALLVEQEQMLCLEYPQALLAEFADAVGGGPSRPADFSFDGLELMGEDQMQESVELVRAQQAAAQKADTALGDLNTLVCTVQGLTTVQVERNPLRPEIYVKALRRVLVKTGVLPQVRLRWMQHMGEALGPELAKVYTQLSKMLHSNGVTAAGFVVTNTTTDVATVRAVAAATPSAEKLAQTLLNVRELRKLLAGEFDRDTNSFAARFEREFEAGERDDTVDFSPTLPAAYEALQEMKGVDTLMQRVADRQSGRVVLAPSASSAATREQIRERMRRRAQGTGQLLGLEVVTLMVENIAGDDRLLVPVQKLVRALEPALLRLVLTDPRFFSDRRHPARQLLEQMTQRSLAWPSVDAPGFAGFIDPLREAIEVLLTTKARGPEPFAFALQSLEEAWGELQKRDRRRRERAVRTLLQAEQRNLLATRLADELRHRTDVAKAPSQASHFVTGPWAQVLAQARLANPQGEPDPGGYHAIVPDLMWSCTPGLAASHGARLARLVGPLLATLRAGLASIDYPETNSRQFFSWLRQTHERALNPQAAGDATRPATLSGALTRDELEAQFTQDDYHVDDPWLGPSEARSSGFLETQPGMGGKALFSPTQPGQTQAPLPLEQAQPGTPLPDVGLAVGAWVEMLMGNGWERCQLSWASPHGTLFMFTTGQGATHSVTRRLLDSMSRAGSMRMVSDRAVVDGALDAVARTALNNSTDLKL